MSFSSGVSRPESEAVRLVKEGAKGLSVEETVKEGDWGSTVSLWEVMIQKKVALEPFS